MKVNVNVKEVTGYNVDISEVKGIKSEVVGDDVRTANVELNYDDASVDINLVPVFKDNNNLSFEGAKEVLSALVEDTKPFSYNKDDDDLLERLAELEHEQWCEWSKNVFADLKYFINIIYSYGIKNVLDEDDKEFFNSQIERSKRWGQLWKPYNELSEGMKEEDRKYARKVLKELQK